MGAYRSKPLTDKLSKDCESNGLVYGASEMQGWRVSMEDAWNGILDFDDSTSMFAVYDGHGGQEVAQYCAKKLPDFIKNTEAYKNGDIKKALDDAFKDIDQSIITEDVIKELKDLAGDQEDDDDSNEAAMLSEEATIPIEELLRKMKQDANATAFEKLIMNGCNNQCCEDNECPEEQLNGDSNTDSKESEDGDQNQAQEKEKDTKQQEKGSATKDSENESDDGEETTEDVVNDEDKEGDDDEEQANSEEESEEESEESEEDEMEDDDACMPQSDEVGKDSGATAIVALLNSDRLLVANVGDSRCVLCREKKAIEMSKDHKPEDEIETTRITKAGGKITHDGRVNGGLNLSRAIGDHNYKANESLLPHEQVISAVPDIEEIKLTKEDKFVILACDGIWNMMTSQEAVDFILEKLAEQEKEGKICLSKICEQVFDHCLAPDTSGDGSGCDNMTCIIVLLNEKQIGKSSSKKRTLDSSKDGGSYKKPEKKQKI